jgi:carbon monoxide dehydrogenase subunit G
VLRDCISGAEEVTFLDPSTLKVRLTVGVGPFKGHGSVRIQFSEETAPSHLKLMVNRSGDHNSAQGSLTVDLAPEGTGTSLQYAGSAVLGGPIAMLDNPVTRPFVDSQVSDFFQKLDQKVG